MRIGARSINGAGIDFPKKIANCFLPGSLWGGYLFGQGVVETIRGQLFALGRPQLDELYRTIEAHEINILFCSPSYAAMIFTEDEITKRALRTIRCFYYVGEPVSDSLAKLLAEHYPEVSVKSLAYTTNETGPIGFQCRHQTGGYHHINEDCVFIEIVDPETGRPLESEEGEIVVTTIANDGMPVLRYRLGDKGRFIHESCPCGTRFKTLLLNGRVGNSLNICGMLVSDKSFLNLIEGAKTEDMQVRIYKDQGKTSVSLLVAHDMLADVDVAALHEKARKDSVLKGVLGEAQFGKLTIEPVTRDQFRVSERTGKKLFFVRED